MYIIAGTLITLSNGVQTPIETIKLGQFLQSWNGEALVPSSLLKIELVGSMPYTLLTYNDGTCLGIVGSASDVDAQGRVLVSREVVEAARDCYVIESAHYGNVIANGLVVNPDPEVVDGQCVDLDLGGF